MMQVHGGINKFAWFDDPIPSNTLPFHSTPFGVPVFQFPTLSLGGQQNYPNYTWQDNFQGRLDVNWHKGKHELKFGGEVQKDRDTKVWDLNRRGTYVFKTLPPAAILNAAFPQDSWNNPTAWKIDPLLPFLQEFDIFFNKDFLWTCRGRTTRRGLATTGASRQPDDQHGPALRPRLGGPRSTRRA